MMRRASHLPLPLVLAALLLGLRAVPPATAAHHGASSQQIAVVVAHADDDILFANPAIAGRIAHGTCVFAVYVTAVIDWGERRNRWRERERASRAAYAAMAGIPDRWLRRPIAIAGRRVAAWALRDHPCISLAFLRIPNSPNTGGGFPSTGNASLYKLWTGELGDLRPVDGGTPYSRGTLISVLRSLIRSVRPRLVITNDYARPFECRPDACVWPFDHSDHLVTGRLARAAATSLYARRRVLGARGYPAMEETPPNVSGAALARKLDIFLAYARHDPAVCQTATACRADPFYGPILLRQYLQRPVPGAS